MKIRLVGADTHEDAHSHFHNFAKPL